MRRNSGEKEMFCEKLFNGKFRIKGILSLKLKRFSLSVLNIAQSQQKFSDSVFVKIETNSEESEKGSGRRKSRRRAGKSKIPQDLKT